MNMQLRPRTKAAKPDRDEEKLQQISADLSDLVCGPDTGFTLDHSMASMTIGSDEKDAKII
jgi:hypothetical protein